MKTNEEVIRETEDRIQMTQLNTVPGTEKWLQLGYIYIQDKQKKIVFLYTSIKLRLYKLKYINLKHAIAKKTKCLYVNLTKHV